MCQYNPISFRKHAAKLFMSILFLVSLSFTNSYSQTQTQTAVKANIAPYMQGYYESLPVDYKTNTTKRYPLLIFLHGSGELGNGTTELPLVLKNGPPKLINQGKFPSSFNVDGKQYSFIVISPQFSSSANYYSAVLALLEHCKAKYRVDETKMYLTGLSLGGLMTFNFCGSSLTNASRFTAILTVCGGAAPVEKYVDNIANAKLPVWVTNNSGDPYNSAARAEETVRLLNAHVPAPPKALLTIFQKDGHDAWTATYDPNFRQDGLSVYEWMLKYSRGSSTAPAPAPPVAEAGTNQTITLPTSSVTLDASKSTVASGYTIKTYAWSKVSGPSSGVITTASGKTTTVTGLVAGTYVFQLKVTDSNGNTDTDTVTIVVNAAPATAITANAGADKTVYLPTRTVTLDGSKSIPTSGSSISSYAWSFVSGPKTPTFSNASGNITTVNWLIPGAYVFQLKVTDKAGKSATDNIIVNVKYINGVLKANAGADQTLTYPLSSVLIVDGTASTAPSTSNVSCSWKRLSGPGTYGTGFNPSTHIITQVGTDLVAGTYQYELTLKDDKGTTSTDVVVVTVKSASATETTPPIAEAGANQTITLPTSSVTVDASASKASSGTSISSYKWTKKSGPTAGTITSATSAKTTITGLTAGTYAFEVLVTDSKGKTATDIVTITVNAAPAVANAGADKTVYLPERTVTLDGSKSTPSSGSSITGYAWSFVSGPKSPTLSNASGNIATATWLIPGVYVFQLKIADKAGKTATDKVTVNVKYADGVLKANAGPDQILAYPLSSALAVVVDGTASTAPSASNVTSSWKRVSGPGTYGTTFNPSTHIVTRVSADLIVGTYQYQLTLKDDKGNSSTDVVTVTVKSGVSARAQSQDTSSQIAAATADAISTSNKALDVKINPNPVTTNMNVWIDGTATGKTSILVYNLNGSLILQQSFTKDVSGLINKSFNVAGLATGTYFVKVVVNNTVMKSVQMIKQ